MKELLSKRDEGFCKNRYVKEKKKSFAVAVNLNESNVKRWICNYIYIVCTSSSNSGQKVIMCVERMSLMIED